MDVDKEFKHSSSDKGTRHRHGNGVANTSKYKTEEKFVKSDKITTTFKQEEPEIDSSKQLSAKKEPLSLEEILEKKKKMEEINSKVIFF